MVPKKKRKVATVIDLDSTTTADELTSGHTYDISVTLTGVYDNTDEQHPRMSLAFEQDNGERRYITLWKNTTPKDVFTYDYATGSTYIFTNIDYEVKDGYENLTATYQTTVENATAQEVGTTDEDETFAGGEPLDHHLDDALNETPDDAETESDSGHVMTSFASRDQLPEWTLHTYTLTATDGAKTDTEYARRTLAYTVRQELYTDHDAAPVATDGLMLLTPEPLGETPLDLDCGVRVEADETRTLDYTTAKDRLLARELVEEGLKRSLWDDYLVRGIDEVLSKEPVLTCDEFDLHERYDLSVEVGHSGRAYLHINFRHRFVPKLTLADIDDDNIYPGLRVKTTYRPRRGHIVWGLRDECATDSLNTLGNQSVVAYHRNNQTPINTDLLDAIEAADRRVVETRRQGHGDDAVSFPQELLAVEPNTHQIKQFASDGFHQQARSKTRLSASRCSEKAQAFAERLDPVRLNGSTVEFSSEFFTGNNEQQLRLLYENGESVLTFRDGARGAHPDETFSKGIVNPPESFEVAVVLPEQQADTCKAQWDTMADLLNQAGAPPTRSETVQYDAFSSPESISLNVAGAIDPSEVDAAFVVLPPDQEGFADLASPTETYDELKKALANMGIYSQMAYFDRFRDAKIFYTRNVALGLLAAAGGVAFTTEHAMPGDADMFIGIDVSRSYPEDGASGQINIAATATAVYKDGTILGHSSTRPQLGEKLQSTDVRDIMKNAILGYQQVTGESPTHIVIHRDGFMNEDLDPATEFLNEQGVEYDIVEIRKQPQTRLLAVSDVQYDTPVKSIAAINQNEPRATVATFGAPEYLATRDGGGLPRPIQIERVAGETDIETLTRQVYLLSQSHIQVHNSTARLPITTAYADQASTHATKGYLVQTGAFESNVGFL
nr:argonaute [Expression vector NLS-NgAgo-pcDNA3.1]